ncbi:MAG TPA: hypothetical protein VE569_01320, partial [Acidimicrobiia bacterium]|nr:hypothetical protein [Acidimicrobiia bacterium]
KNAQVVAEVVARLDGLPLAIELAATRMKILSPTQMLDHLDDRLSFLTTGQRTLPQRQQTLRAVIEWSYNLLDEAEKALFACLSVFSGGWTMDAAAAVCDFAGLALDPLGGMGSLIDKSLVRRVPEDEEPRFSMLETIREFARERFDASPDAGAISRRHAAFFHDLVLEAEPHLFDTRDTEWLGRCDRESDNIRVALRWAIDADEAGLAQEMAGALWRFWQIRNRLAEAARWFDEVLAMPSGQRRTRARAKALGGAGGIAWWRAGPDAAPYYQEALDIEREYGDPRGLAEALFNMAYAKGAATRDFEAATKLLKESLDLYRKAHDDLGVNRVQWALTSQLAISGDWDSLVPIAEEQVEMWQGRGDPIYYGEALMVLAAGYARTNRITEARTAALEAVNLFDETPLRDVAVGAGMLGFASLASTEGRYEESLRMSGAAMSFREKAGGPPTDLILSIIGDPVEDARANLPEETARQAWESGQSMTEDEAIAAARVYLTS